MRAGRVSVDGRVVTDPEFPTRAGISRIQVDGEALGQQRRVYLMLNKPRGLVVSAADEQGRDTVYTLLAGSDLPWLGPVGRLDQASEGLLLMSNDSVWAAGITEPAVGLVKTYHVQVNGIPDAALLERMQVGVTDRGEALAAVGARLLRQGSRNSWLELQLDEGRNRHIRRLLAALELPVLRLMRVAIGPLSLGNLAKGAWRELTAEEVAALAQR